MPGAAVTVADDDEPAPAAAGRDAAETAAGDSAPAPAAVVAEGDGKEDEDDKLDVADRAGGLEPE